MAKNYKICFVGLGSIATRHIRNLHTVLSERDCTCEIDLFRSRHGKAVPEHLEPLISRVCYEKEELQEKYDIVFVTNPTALHYETIQDFQDITDAFFIEKPVFHTSDIDTAKLALEGKTCYVACPLRYTGAIRYLKEHVPRDEIRSIRVVSASYLPLWRPDTDYRTSYSAKKELGGGVSIDLIHEWDYTTYLMGMPESVHAIIKKVSDLEIDSDDLAVYIADYGDCVAELHLDYFTRNTIRRIEITTNEELICADLVEQTVSRSGQPEVISFVKDRDDFQKLELIHFLNILNGTAENTNDISNAVKVLAIAEGKAV